jgi:regulator of RNase E activity RraA
MIKSAQRYCQVSDSILNFLQRTDTCLVSNAIETFNVRMRNEGFIQGTARCQFPGLSPVAGYAVTGRIRTNAPPIANRCYYHRPDWWEYVASFPSPKIVVLHDVDQGRGTGTVCGEIHARISKALGCVAHVTNGAIRDLPALESLDYQCFASGTSVSHAYAHIIDFGGPVEIGGLNIYPGDLLHGDCHGVHTVPMSVVELLPEAIRVILEREAELISFCDSADFSLEKLTAILNRELRACQPPNRR